MVNQKLILFSIQWESLLKPEIWLDAATQIFFSLSLGFGALVAFASYNPINNNIIRDSYIIVLTDCATAVFGGVVVFSILGFREHVTGIPVTEVSFRRGGRFLYSYSKRGCTGFSMQGIPVTRGQEYFPLSEIINRDLEHVRGIPFFKISIKDIKST